MFKLNNNIYIYIFYKIVKNYEIINLINLKYLIK